MTSPFLKPVGCLVVWDEIRGLMASISLELEEEPDKTDAVLYAIMGDMFDLDMEVEGDMLTITGNKYDIWSWLTFSMWYSVDES
jgi:hypothetical protein